MVLPLHETGMANGITLLFSNSCPSVTSTTTQNEGSTDLPATVWRETPTGTVRQAML